jgi:hypothetical protein
MHSPSAARLHLGIEIGKHVSHEAMMRFDAAATIK